MEETTNAIVNGNDVIAVPVSSGVNALPVVIAGIGVAATVAFAVYSIIADRHTRKLQEEQLHKSLRVLDEQLKAIDNLTTENPQE